MRTNVSTRDELPVINMVLHCPQCATQHIDDVETTIQYAERIRKFVASPARPNEGFPGQWTNPPHRSHLCHECGCVWRPADVCTNGVAAIATRGKVDTWPAA